MEFIHVFLSEVAHGEQSLDVAASKCSSTFLIILIIDV